MSEYKIQPVVAGIQTFRIASESLGLWTSVNL